MSTSTDTLESMVQEVVRQIRGRGPEFTRVPEELVREVAREALAGAVLSECSPPEAAWVDQVAARVRARMKLTEEEREIRGKLAAKLGANLDELDAIVHRQFEGATRDIADRYAQAVRQERARRVTESVLQGLAGKEQASLSDLLHGAANAVAEAVLRVQGKTPANDWERRLESASGRSLSESEVAELIELARRGPPVALASGDIAQVAQAVSQAVQQVAVNVQKIVSVALENERAADAEHPRYYDP